MDSPIPTDYTMVSQLALRVALQTMKERCLSLQQRLSVVEEENELLRGRLDTEQNQANESSLLQQNKSIPHNSIELDNLRSQVSELNRQKVQLSDHINMVANENRKLWSRLSQIAKEQDVSNTNQAKGDADQTSHSNCDELHSPKTNNQNLIRSRTFTQHSPNPNLRLKVIEYENTEKENDEEHSLEEVLLVQAAASVDISDDDDDGSNKDLKSDDMMGVCETELGFTYLNVQASDDDFNIEAKKCLEGLHKIRLEAMAQQMNVTSAIATLENRFATAMQNCSVCAKKPEMLDKNLDTLDIFPEIQNYLHHRNDTDDDSDTDVEKEGNAKALPDQSEFIRKKLEADKNIKVCPMCGMIFGAAVSFDSFCAHVESHFYQDSSSDSEQNYEFVAHTVGDF